jgi:hypothetical protein
LQLEELGGLLMGNTTSSLVEVVQTEATEGVLLDGDAIRLSRWLLTTM